MGQSYCLWDPPPLYSKKIIKNGSYGTINLFKNYFATIFSVSVFNKISCIQMVNKMNHACAIVKTYFNMLIKLLSD